MGLLPCGAVAALAVALLSQPGDRWKAIRAAWPVGCLRSANFPDSWAAPFCLDDLVVRLVRPQDYEPGASAGQGSQFDSLSAPGDAARMYRVIPPSAPFATPGVRSP